MLGRVWLLGPHKIYPFSLPTAMAQEAVLSLAQLAETTLCPCTHPLPRLWHHQDCLLLLGTEGHLCTVTQPEASRH